MTVFFAGILHSGDPADVGDEIPVALVPACRGKIVSRVGCQQRHQRVDQSGLATPGGSDDGGAAHAEQRQLRRFKARLKEHLADTPVCTEKQCSAQRIDIPHSVTELPRLWRSSRWSRREKGDSWSNHKATIAKRNSPPNLLLHTRVRIADATALRTSKLRCTVERHSVSYD